jgi:hypothetical protein
VSPVSTGDSLFDTLPTVPLYTEARIQELCVEAIAATTQGEIERVVEELRRALEEHTRLARISLGSQLVGMSVLGTVIQLPPNITPK